MIAPAKINWTLEVLRKRPDGYHEVLSVLQTIDLHDIVTLEMADDISLDVTGEAGVLVDEDPRHNLAYRAAVAFRARTGMRGGARITLEKHIPIAAGLGGGSSDAAAVLRGLNVLWETGQAEMNLIEIAGEIGSDPPFFVVGGTVMASGRGDQVVALRDAVAPAIVLATPPASERGEKTASMYAALTPDDYTEGDATFGLRDTVEAGRTVVDAEIANVFERVTPIMQPDTENALRALRAQGYRPHLCGSGPSFFLLAPDEPAIGSLTDRLTALGFEPRVTHALPRALATHSVPV